MIVLCITSTSTISAASHLERYISGYMITYPTSSILVLHSSTSAQDSRKSTTAQESQYAAAIDAIVTARRASSNSNKGHGQVLLHVFGDQGAALAAQLAWAHRLSTERPLDAKAILYDAAPQNEGVARRVEGQRLRQRQRHEQLLRQQSSLGASSSTSIVNLLLPGLQRGRAGRKSHDYNVLDGSEDVPSVGRAFQHVIGMLLQFLVAVYTYTLAFASVSANRASTSLSRSLTAKATRKTSKDLDDLELIAPGCKKCHVHLETGVMTCLEMSEGGRVGEDEQMQHKQRRDSGVADEDGEDEYEREEKRQWGGREWRFEEVADDLFWEGVKGLWIG